MMAKLLMIQGTGSSVGKSILATALCRIFKQDGYRVAPFKSQNMALNSFVTKEGGEMGRSQVVQAEAAGIDPHVDMNPVLLKPEADAKSQVVVLGKPKLTLKAGDYYRYTPELLTVAMGALERLRSQFDIVVIEGAGSPAEVNLKEREIVNMRIAKLAGAPVLLVGDIDKGGVFASLVGTLVLLDEEEQALIRGFIINKFRGDISLLQSGLDYLEERTGRPVIGVVPYYHDIIIAQEDSIRRQERETPTQGKEVIDIAVIHFARISNSTDFEPLQVEEGVKVRYVPPHGELGEPDAIILPGTKSTISDLALIRETGLADEIVQRSVGGTPVVGICGGYQILGKEIRDPLHVESGRGSVAGLGLLDVVTIFEPIKTTTQVKARVASNRGLLANSAGEEVIGYEIHMGKTSGDGVEPAFYVTHTPDGEAKTPDGAVSSDGQTFGTYLHGLFDNPSFRHEFLARLAQRKAMTHPQRRPILSKEQHYNKLADLVRRSLNMELVYQICGLEASK